MSQVTIEAIDKVLARLPKATYKQAVSDLGGVIQISLISISFLFNSSISKI